MPAKRSRYRIGAYPRPAWANDGTLAVATVMITGIRQPPRPLIGRESGGRGWAAG